MTAHTSATFSTLIDLAAEHLGGAVLAASDDFFAEKEKLIKPGRGVFIPDKYTERGKWMDGWESRRRRGGPDHDWCILRLGAPGLVRAFDIDTNHFLGNHPPFASVEGAYASTDTIDEAQWFSLLRQSPLQAGSQNLFTATNDRPVTHVRLNIFPDGGVARLRVYGDVQPVWGRYEKNSTTLGLLKEGDVDLASILNGGQALACSDMFFSPMNNLILPNHAQNMGQGWETRRKRQPGHDWIIVELGARGSIELAVLDTAFFKGNYPDRASIEGLDATGIALTEVVKPNVAWTPCLAPSPMSADTRHHFQKDALLNSGPFTHVRLNIFPDGGVSRMRLYGPRADKAAS